MNFPFLFTGLEFSPEDATTTLNYILIVLEDNRTLLEWIVGVFLFIFIFEVIMGRLLEKK